MEDYNINFQEILDNLTIQELKDFKEKLVRCYAQRLAQELKATNERLRHLNYLQEK